MNKLRSYQQEDVNKLLKQFENAKSSMKMLSNNRFARKKLGM